MMGLRKLNPLRRFSKSEDASMTVEFAILFPILFFQLLMAVEFGIWTLRQTFLERGLDMTVREIRLSTETPPTYEEVKDMICANAGFIENCDATMRLEMRPSDPRAFTPMPADADCIDLAEPIQPEREFVAGGEHELMQLRACVKFNAVFPTIGLGFALAKDGSGMAQMTAMSSFVQEPK